MQVKPAVFWTKLVDHWFAPVLELACPPSGVSDRHNGYDYHDGFGNDHDEHGDYHDGHSYYHDRYCNDHDQESICT